MKRADLKVGQHLAVLSPSQLKDVDSRWGPRARQVVVLDVRPVFRQTYASYYRDNTVSRTVTTEVTGTVQAKDFTYELGEKDRDYDGQAKRSAKVLVIEAGWNREDGPRYTVEVVPLSQLAMPWAEFVERRRRADERTKEADAARARQREAEDLARDERAGVVDELNARLATTEFTARGDSERGVYLTGPRGAIIDLVDIITRELA